MRTQSAQAKGAILDTVGYALALHPALGYRTLQQKAITCILSIGYYPRQRRICDRSKDKP